MTPVNTTVNSTKKLANLLSEKNKRMNKIINPKPIAILMATYNGEKYLQEQIDSILSQTYTDWTLYIQDDGSSDNTIGIINSYIQKEKKCVLIDRGLTRQGAGMNFMSLLNIVESQYYMFCDQDDIWLPNKIVISLNKIKEEENKHKDTPIIVHTDRTHVDSQLNTICKSEFNPRGINEKRLALKLKKNEES